MIHRVGRGYRVERTLATRSATRSVVVSFWMLRNWNWKHSPMSLTFRAITRTWRCFTADFLRLTSLFNMMQMSVSVMRDAIWNKYSEVASYKTDICPSTAKWLKGISPLSIRSLYRLTLSKILVTLHCRKIKLNQQRTTLGLQYILTTLYYFEVFFDVFH